MIEDVIRACAGGFFQCSFGRRVTWKYELVTKAS